MRSQQVLKMVSGGRKKDEARPGNEDAHFNRPTAAPLQPPNCFFSFFPPSLDKDKGRRHPRRGPG